MSSGHPAGGGLPRLLVGSSCQAQLVMVDGHGSAAVQLLHHADCPVLVHRR